mmetsp:Transcript_44214/g.86777  ORF Transcript_44214/g.86777 Transcript_44214/m.86777 type:complete len:137 (-) Transcript_44214:138-548(-)
MKSSPKLAGLLSTAELLTWSGVTLVLHSAYSCLHFREIIPDPLTGTAPPHDVIVEALLGFFLVLFSRLSAAGEFLPVCPSSSWIGGCSRSDSSLLHILDQPPFQTYLTSGDFDGYSHRARVMPLREKLVSSQTCLQ